MYESEPNSSLPAAIADVAETTRARWTGPLIKTTLLLAGLAALATGVPIGHSLVQESVAKRISAEADRHGLNLSWSELSIDFDLNLHLEEVSVTREQGLDVTFDSLEASWELSKIFKKEPLPSRIQFKGMRAEIDLRALTRTGGASQSDVTAETASVLNRFARVQGLTVKGTQSDVVVHGLPGPVSKVSLEEISIFGEPDRDSWHGALIARCSSGCGPDLRRLEGEITLNERGLKVSASLDEKVTFEVPVKKLARDVPVTLRGVEAFLPRHKGGSATISALDLSLPFDIDGFEGHVSVERLESDADASGPKGVVRLERPIVRALRHPNPGPRQKLNSEKRPWKSARVREHANSRRGQILKALPDPALLLSIKDKALPWLRRVSIEGGQFKYENLDLHLREVSVRHSGSATLVSIAQDDGRLSISAEEGSRVLKVSLEDVDVQRFTSKLLPKTRWMVGGTISGEVQVGVGGARFEGMSPSFVEDRDHLGGFHLSGKLQVRHGMLFVPGLSSAPIEGQRARVKFNASYRPADEAQGADNVMLRRLTVSLPSRQHKDRWAQVNLEADIQHILDDREPEVAMRLWMEKTPCGVAFGAIPKAMLPHLHDQVKAKGHFSPDLTFIVNMKNPYGLFLDLEGLPGSCRLKTLGEYSPAYLNTKFSQEVREGVTRAGIMVGPGSGSYVPINSIPTYARALTFLTEEGGFYRSSGFSLSLIKRAVRLNLDKNRYAYGGSTLSQQLVKNLFLTRDKTLSRKLEEAFIVWKMEELLTKDRILELYLNCIEYGPDLYGIKRAARFYFGKRPSRLTPIEAAFLAALKPSPLVGMNFMGEGHTPISGWWYDRLESLVKGMHRRGATSGGKEPYIVFFRTFRGNRQKFREEALRKRAEMGAQAIGQDPVGVKKKKSAVATGRKEGADVTRAKKPRGIRLTDLPSHN